GSEDRRAGALRDEVERGTPHRSRPGVRVEASGARAPLEAVRRSPGFRTVSPRDGEAAASVRRFQRPRGTVWVRLVGLARRTSISGLAGSGVDGARAPGEGCLSRMGAMASGSAARAGGA